MRKMSAAVADGEGLILHCCIAARLHCFKHAACVLAEMCRHCEIIRPMLARCCQGGELGMVMIPRERCSYSAIVDRPPLMLPHGARIAVWTVVNLEFWSISRPMARQVLPAPTGQVLVPD